MSTQNRATLSISDSNEIRRAKSTDFAALDVSAFDATTFDASTNDFSAETLANMAEENLARKTGLALKKSVDEQSMLQGEKSGANGISSTRYAAEFDAKNDVTSQNSAENIRAQSSLSHEPQPSEPQPSEPQPSEPQPSEPQPSEPRAPKTRAPKVHSPKSAAALASRRTFLVDFGIRAAFVLFLLLLWQGAHYFMVTRPADPSRGALFPSPSQTFGWLWNGFGLSYFSGNYEPPPGAPMPHNFWEVLKQADYPVSIGLSILRLLQGYGIAVTLGFPLGLLVARFPLAEKTIGWLASSLQSLPSVCWTPLALLWFGFISVTAPILFVTVMGALFSTVVSVSDGIANVPPLMSRAGRTLGASGPRLYFSVLLPAALPGIISGLKVGWAFAWRSLMAAEIIVNSGGLGFLLQRDRDQSDAEGVVTTILVIIFIGLGVQTLVFKPIERRLQNLWGLNPRT